MQFPPKQKLDYYGERYSIPVVPFDEKGRVLPYMVRWCFHTDGWVIATLPDGPSASDYDLKAVDTWMNPQFYFMVAK